jgi:hypothetical protein
MQDGEGRANLFTAKFAEKTLLSTENEAIITAEGAEIVYS